MNICKACGFEEVYITCHKCNIYSTYHAIYFNAERFFFKDYDVYLNNDLNFLTIKLLSNNKIVYRGRFDYPIVFRSSEDVQNFLILT